MLRTSFII